uniref:L1 transposable element RRM domain-containing protein n=1 Tax=Equus caballus TaxID=9796 RepID=A0A9L0TPW8_HORSE
MLQAEEQREVRLKRNEETLRELSDTIRRCNIRVIGIPEGEEKEKGAESLFKEIRAENFPNLEEREVRLKRNEETLRELSDTIRRCNIRVIGIPEGEEKEKGAESLFKEIMAENFPNLVREMDLQVTEATRSPNFIKARRPTPRHIVVKLAKVNDKEKILRTARQKKLTYKGTPIRLS